LSQNGPFEVTKNGAKSSARAGPGGPTTCKLRFRGQDLLLAQGQFLIGRQSAHIVIPSKMVSRRHALVLVGAEGTRIQDLGSVNGVYVNGQRLDRTARALSDGDRIVIGGEELVFNVVRPAYEDVSIQEITVAGEDAIVPSAEEEEEEDHYQPTHRVSSLDLLGPIADKALAMSRNEDAERLLGEHLSSILADARAGRRVLPNVLDKASHYAVLLAQSTGKGGWFDYVIALNDALAAPLNDRLVVEMQVALARVDAVDGARLDRYVTTMRRLMPNFDAEQKRQVQRVEELTELALRKRRA
jgi:pSer/pThr/pTyr-binding forkhead associated (FHA) protein